MNWKPAKLHTPKSGWYISYYVIHLTTKQWVRKRIKLNNIKPISVRRQYAHRMIAEINKMLAAGWNPFLE